MNRTKQPLKRRVKSSSSSTLKRKTIPSNPRLIVTGLSEIQILLIRISGTQKRGNLKKARLLNNKLAKLQKEAAQRNY